MAGTSSASHGDGPKKARIEIIPLIDVVFFLLATFVMVSLSMVKHQGIPVVVPRASTGVRGEHADQVRTCVSPS